MNWTNVRLILEREVRDQLRDRRTLFMIFVLPILLYPLLGMVFLQIAQFVHEHPTSVFVVGGLPEAPEPALVVGSRFADELFTERADARLLIAHRGSALQLLNEAEQITHPQGAAAGKRNGAAPAKQAPDLAAKATSTPPAEPTAAAIAAAAEKLVRAGLYQVVVYFPPEFAPQLEAYRRSLSAGAPLDEQAAPVIPAPQLYFNAAQEKSQLARARVSEVLGQWRTKIGEQNLVAGNLPASAASCFRVVSHDVAEAGRREAAMWSKVFPFLLLIWALTGAFYPAIDLCAGEKERGTLETLLSSPAARTEIVWGKLLTVMLFSMATVVLNLVSLGITGLFVAGQLPQFGPPPWSSLLWLLLALVPVSALFSALCLALAAFARSTKEGQYYLMPLVLVTMPLVIVPMAPGVELTLGNSLIPVTGIVLLLRSVVEGDYANALPFVPPVVAVTVGCCLLSIRWAVDQFNSESVLFRESERVDLRVWLWRLLRDREPTPSVAEAVLCGVLILVIKFFLSFAVAIPTNFAGLAQSVVLSQLLVVLAPALVMTFLLTSNPRKTLLLVRARRWTLPAAALLALCVHPLANVLQRGVLKLYPIKDEVALQLESLFSGPANLWLMLLFVAVLPAICEELAFRGFILSGFRHLGHKWRAIVLSSVFFGLTHAVFQQSLITSLLGVLIGYLAVQTGSLWPGMVFHVTHNSLALLASRVTAADYERIAPLRWIANLAGERGLSYHWTAAALAAWATVSLLYWLHRQPYRMSPEESLQEAIDHHAAQSLMS
ncbi:MAG: ABC transporter permease subunit [Pirellulales bacterium]|nr:ABC transporter permease subunit [Pirellulales bacterium]